jgi:hypothetical protein
MLDDKAPSPRDAPDPKDHNLAPFDRHRRTNQANGMVEVLLFPEAEGRVPRESHSLVTASLAEIESQRRGSSRFM